MARDDITAAIRTGSSVSDSLVARQIDEYSLTLYAGPSDLLMPGKTRANHTTLLARGVAISRLHDLADAP